MTNPNGETWIAPIFYAIERFLKKSGYFSHVNTGEPKSAPGVKVQAAFWPQSIRPIGIASGLAATTAHVLFIVRIFTNFKAEPQDQIDPKIMMAASNIVRLIHNDFDFEGTIRNVDIFGHHGENLGAEAGYLEVDKKHYRVMDVRIPCIVNDVWVQTDTTP